MAATLTTVKWLLLAGLFVLCLVSGPVAALAKHTFGAVAWAGMALGLLVLAAITFGERFLTTPAAVASVVTTAASVGLKFTDNFLIWLKDIRDDLAAKKIPAEQATALAMATLKSELDKAAAAPLPIAVGEIRYTVAPPINPTAPVATGGPVA